MLTTPPSAARLPSGISSSSSAHAALIAAGPSRLPCLDSRLRQGTRCRPLCFTTSTLCQPAGGGSGEESLCDVGDGGSFVRRQRPGKWQRRGMEEVD
ncbi:unnamed protein product [Linum trigynum]|uniref:Uncharacterized protein n=1 Tax=Linum trigynum TaxID=586398 RepID=A0AAV2CDQ2_9ROSI